MKRRQRGFAIISAIIMLVLLGVLGAFMVTITNNQQIGLARDVLGSRAYYAARAGMEYGAYRALRGAPPACGPATLNITLEATPFRVQVACTQFGPYDEAGNSSTIFQITATATTGSLGGFDYVERQLQAVVSTP